MAYKCVHCNAIYKDGSREVLQGCVSCGSKFFFYIKEEKLQEIMQRTEVPPQLSLSEKQQMETDVREIAGITDQEQPVFLDFESITIVKPGKYLLDIAKLFSKDKPRIYHLEDGKYIVDLTAHQI
ncbi:MAG TPA: Zn-ribbon containing protein [Candidatus Nanoarchaeia archaeon]|nr:Zn-ribbon containing protein [Candidatus Nanoarchaeia archaeon]